MSAAELWATCCPVRGAVLTAVCSRGDAQPPMWPVGTGGCAPIPAPRAALSPRYSEINAISTACSYGIAECQQLATTLFQQWKQNVSNNP